MRIYPTKEQQIEELYGELQGYVDDGPKPIAKIDLERVAQFFIDEHGDDLLLTEEEVQDAGWDVWEEWLAE